MVPTDNTLAPYPPELIARITDQAARAADLTIRFLEEVGLAPPPGETTTLPGDFLLELGAAMRLLAWEMAGVDVREPGLPTARDAIHRAFQNASHPIDDGTHPCQALDRIVFRITLERLAWVGPRNLNAEILLDLADEDALVDAMAHFLWENRASLASGIEGETS